MRKTFKLFCAAAIAALTVSSCGKMFDEIDNRLDSIETRLTELEAALNADVANLATLDATHKALDKAVKDLEAALKAADATSAADIKALQESVAALQAQLAGVKVESKNGTVVVTIGENSFTLSKNGVLTIVEVEGVKYWALVDPATGEATNLNVKVGHDIKFKVDPETAEVLICYDGDKYVGTGVYAAEGADTLIGDVEETDDYVTITIGDATYTLAKWADDNSSLVLGRTQAYFVYGVSKKVELTAKDITEYYVMSKPDGWKATMDGTTLTITAPAKALIDLGAAEAEGEVLVHATAATGACKVVKLDVTAGEALKLSIKDGVVTLFNANVVEFEDAMYGDVWYEFADVWFGLTPIAEYAAYESFEAFMATEPETLSNLQAILFNSVEDQSEYIYKEGVYEEFVASMSLVDIVENSYSGFELDEEEVYVMWVVPQGESSFNYDEAIYVMTDSYVDIDDTESVYNNVSMDALFYGADGFVVGATDKAQFDEWGIDETFTYEDALAEYLVGNYMPGPLTSFNGGDLSAMGDMLTEGAHSLKLADVIVSGGMGGGMMPMPGMGAGASVSPDSEYFVWVMPYYKDKAEYTFEDLVLLTVKTKPLVYNAAIKATVTLDEVTATSAVISLVPAEGGSTAYELMTAESFEEFKVDGAVDQDMLVEYLQNNWAITEEDLYGEPAYVEEYGEWMIEPNTSYVFVTYNKVGGEYSVDYSFTFTTPFATPNKAQWMFKSEILDMQAVGEPLGATYCFDLGVSFPTNYPEIFPDPNTAVIGIDYEIIGAPAGTWMPAFPAYGAYTITPTDEESGVIVWLGADIPYSEFDGESCKFDLSLLLGMEPGEFIIDATLAEEEVSIQAQ